MSCSLSGLCVWLHGKEIDLKDNVAGIRSRLLTQAVIRFETEPSFQAWVDWKEFGQQIVDGRRGKIYAS
jgi:transposase